MLLLPQSIIEVVEQQLPSVKVPRILRDGSDPLEHSEEILMLLN
jgi:hypothetical protein